MNLKYVSLTVIYCLLVATSIFCQNADRVDIYAISFKVKYPLEEMNADYVRAHYQYHLEVTDREYIEEFIELLKMFYDSAQDSTSKRKEPESGVRLVVDFRSCSSLNYFMTLGFGQTMHIDFSLGTVYEPRTITLSNSEVCSLMPFLFIYNELRMEELQCP